MGGQWQYVERIGGLDVMPLRTETSEEPVLNLTPMIDVVFLLIIFFMVGARFTQEAQEQQFQVQLPTAAPVETLGRQPDPLVITVTAAGQASIAGRPSFRVDEGRIRRSCRRSSSGSKCVIHP